MSSRNQVSIGCVLGASGSGKSSLMKLEQLELAPRRRIFWDPKREYGGFAAVVDKLEQLARGMRSERNFSIAFHPAGSRRAMRAQFDVFCKLAAAAGDLWCIVDELADVTEPGWAPEGWEILTRQGRHAGVTIRGASQRPAEIDKSFFGNASHLAVFRLNAEGDVDRCAKLLGVAADRVRALKPLEFFTRDMLTGAISQKKVTPAELERLPA